MEIIDVKSKIICRLGYDEKTNELVGCVYISGLLVGTLIYTQMMMQA